MENVLNILKHVKNNWILVVVLLISLFFLRELAKDNIGLRRNLSPLNDSIAQVNAKYYSMIDRLSEARGEAQMTLIERDAYRDTLDWLRDYNILIRNNYEKEIANLRNVPTDTLFRDVTEWLDGLPF